MGKSTKEIESAVPMAVVHGERFENWYLFKTFIRKQGLPLNYKGSELPYLFHVWDYNYRFIMPSKIEFSAGTIHYSDAERLFGVFRFPRNAEGDFFTPLSMQEIQKRINGLSDLTEDQINKMLELSPPVVFNAFKIPRYGFEYIDVNAYVVKEISDLTTPEYASEIKSEFDRVLEGKVEEVKQKIMSTPDNLLILKNTLNKTLRDFKEVSFMTNEIIHI